MRRVFGWMVVLGALGTAAYADGTPVDRAPAQKARATNWSEVDVVTLRDAAARGLVKAVGRKPHSYRSIELDVRNVSSAPVAVDLAGSTLSPGGGCQRLGIGPPVTPSTGADSPPGTVVLQLEPKGRHVLRVQTCCLDANRPAPSKETFRASKKPIRSVREKVLRWWAANPEMPQGAVNAAIWQNRSDITSTRTVPERRKRAPQAALHRDRYYQLRDGELTAFDEEGSHRFLGTEIERVFPTDQAVYVVAAGSGERMGLWRLPVTGADEWKHVADVHDQHGVLAVVPVRKGLLLATGKGLARVDADGSLVQVLEAAQAETLSLRRTARGLTVTVLRPPLKATDLPNDMGRAAFHEIWRLDHEGRHPELDKRYWNVGGVVAGPAGVFALSSNGGLRHLTKRAFKDLGVAKGYARIAAVGTRIVWVVDGRGRLVAVDPGDGSRIAATGIRLAGVDPPSVDPVTGDLAYVAGGKFMRLSARDGQETRMPDTAREPSDR